MKLFSPSAISGGYELKVDGLRVTITESLVFRSELIKRVTFDRTYECQRYVEDKINAWIKKYPDCKII